MIEVTLLGGRLVFDVRHPGWGLLALSAVATGLFFVAPYLTLNAALSRIPLNQLFPAHFLWLSFHAAPSGLALILGPFQFLPSLRAHWPAAHRIAGRTYLVCVLLGSIAAVVSTAMTTAGFAAQVGFLLLVLAWLYSGFRAYVAARSRRFAEHRVWMIRNYALTFAAVLLRVFLLVGLGYRQLVSPVPFDQVYTASVWGSILVSLTIAEWFIAPAAAGAVRAR